MWRLVLIAGALALSACVMKPPVKPATPESHADNLKVGCYTVDLFDPYRLQFPENGVPRANSKFIGVWKDAAWDGEWCHDLYVTEVRQDGTVTLLDAYGPSTKQNREATVFKRQAVIKDGALTFTSVGGASVVYRLSENGNFLIGRRIDALGKSEITMARRDGVAVPPIPPKKPARRS